MSLGQDIVATLMQHAIEGVIGVVKKQRVAHMTPEELDAWRSEERKKIHKEAIEMAHSYFSESTRPWLQSRAQREQGLDRVARMRRYEVFLLAQRGLEMSQYLLEGVDIRGVDLRLVRGLSQDHINRANGDETTLLPGYLQAPLRWSGKKIDPQMREREERRRHERLEAEIEAARPRPFWRR
jgi:hypothetical protein